MQGAELCRVHTDGERHHQEQARARAPARRRQDPGAGPRDSGRAGGLGVIQRLGEACWVYWVGEEANGP